MTWPLTLMILAWVGFGLAMFVLGAYLVGPTIYHRQLIRWARRYRDRPELDHDEIRRRITEL